MKSHRLRVCDLCIGHLYILGAVSYVRSSQETLWKKFERYTLPNQSRIDELRPMCSPYVGFNDIAYAVGSVVAYVGFDARSRAADLRHRFLLPDGTICNISGWQISALTPV